MSSYLQSALLLFILLAAPPAAAEDTAPSCIGRGCHELPAAAAGHEPVLSGSCIACHRPGNAFRPGDHDETSFPPPPTPSAPCLDCHGGEDSLGDGAMSHGDGGTECPDCHLPHESTYPHLLRSPYPEASYAQFSLEIYGICWECHDSSLATAKMTEKTGFRQGRRNFHYSHLHKRKGMTCRICHEPHANDRPFLIRSTLAREDAGWSGEMRFVISREGGSCIGGCHKDLSYSR